MGAMQFTIIRFIPDLIRNEPVNVGLIATCENRKFHRVVNLETFVRRDWLCSADQVMLDWFVQSWFVESHLTIPELCRRSFQGNLQFYDQLAGLTDDPEKTFEELYAQYVGE